MERGEFVCETMGRSGGKLFVDFRYCVEAWRSGTQQHCFLFDVLFNSNSPLYFCHAIPV